MHMDSIRERLAADLQLAGLMPTTKKFYMGVARRLVAFCKRSPVEVSRDDIRRYLLDLQRRRSASTVRGHRGALLFLFTHTVPRPGLMDEMPKPRSDFGSPSCS